MARVLGAILTFMFFPLTAFAGGPADDVVNPWYLCIGKVAGRQPDLLKNPEVAIERGFEGCRAEEAAVRQWGDDNGLSPSQTNAAITAHKLKVKAHLIDSIDRPAAKRR